MSSKQLKNGHGGYAKIKPAMTNYWTSMREIRLSLLILLFITLCGCSSTKKLNVEKNDYIGTAKMLDDGSITLSLRAEDENSEAVGHSFFEYKPDDPDYKYIKNHLGDIKEGETKPVPPFPDKK